MGSERARPTTGVQELDDEMDRLRVRIGWYRRVTAITVLVTALLVPSLVTLDAVSRASPQLVQLAVAFSCPVPLSIPFLWFRLVRLRAREAALVSERRALAPAGDAPADAAARAGAIAAPDDDRVREFRIACAEIWRVQNGVSLHHSAAAAWILFGVPGGACIGGTASPRLGGAAIGALIPAVVAIAHLWRGAVLRGRAGFLEEVRRHYAAALGIEPAERGRPGGRTGEPHVEEILALEEEIGGIRRRLASGPAQIAFALAYMGFFACLLVLASFQSVPGVSRAVRHSLAAGLMSGGVYVVAHLLRHRSLRSREAFLLEVRRHHEAALAGPGAEGPRSGSD